MRRQHLNTRTTNQAHQELTIADVIGAEAAALKLAVIADDQADVAYTLANLAELVGEAQRQLLNDHTTIDAVAPGIWRTNGFLVLPKHTRNH